MGAEAEAVRAVLASRVPDIRVVGEDEVADFMMIKPRDLDDMIEDAAAAAAYARTRGKEFIPSIVVDRLLSGENPVKVWREHRGFTLLTLGEAIGLGDGYLSQIENGQRKGTVATLKKIAHALSVDLDDLSASPR
jgi:DNA-binding XRE family transcriptional regulator